MSVLKDKDLPVSNEADVALSKAIIPRATYLKNSLSFLGSAVVTAYLGFEISLYGSSQKNEENYGTLSDPHFVVNQNLKLENQFSYQKLIKMEIGDLTKEDYDFFKRNFKDIENHLNSTLKKLEKLKTPELLKLLENNELRSGEEVIANEVELISKHPEYLNGKTRLTNLFRIFTEFETRYNDFCMSNDHTLFKLLAYQAANEITNNISKQLSHKDLIDQFGTPEVYVRKMIKDLTGKNLPIEVKFEVRDIDDQNVVGYSKFLSQETVARDQYYAGVVLILAHEAGHLLALHEEDAIFKNRSRSKEEVNNWEEACAYAFEATVAAAITEKELKGVAAAFISVSQRELLNDFYSGRNSTECHRVGMAYYDAALTVLGSPGAAYNFLASNTELTDEMKAVMLENQRLSEVLKKGQKLHKYDLDQITKTLRERFADIQISK
jgi:hypothetical protein